MMKLIKSQAAWDTAFKKAGSNAEALKRQYHTLACSALEQCSMKNTNWANDLVNDLKGRRIFKQADFIDWMHAHSPMRFDFKERKFEYKADKGDYDMATAQAEPFFDTEDAVPTKKLKTEAQAIRTFAQAMARRILADDNEDSVDDFVNYPSSVRAEITNYMLKEGTIKWVSEYEAQATD